jgi:hypothetical protein
MNLNNNPTKDQLRDLLRPFDDRAAHHVLWVDRGGEVHITPMVRVKWGRPPEPPQDVLDNAVVRFETFWAGNGYVGSDVSDEWITDAFDWLLRDWAAANANGKPVLIEI